MDPPTTGIRPLERDDLPQVASLYQVVMRSGARVAAPRTEAFFARTLLDHPWADPEIPSLVQSNERDEVIGFLGSHTRRLRFDGERVRAAYVGHLMAAPQAGRRPVGAILLRKFLGGPQELSITDTAAEPTRRMWVALGGRLAHLSGITWTRVFRPGRLAGELLWQRRGHDTPGRLARPLSSALDAMAARVAGDVLRVEPPRSSAVPLTSASLLDGLSSLADSLRLHVDYDEEFLDWTFAELDRLEGRGRVVGCLVRADDRALGWYVYLLRAGGVSQVLQVAAGEGGAGAVLDHLFHHAQTSGAAALHGRVEPRLLESLTRRKCLLIDRGRTLFHSRRPELVSTATSPDAFLTRMDGEWWSAPPSG